MTMSTEMRHAIDRVLELWNTGDLGIADELFAPDYVNHDPNNPEVTDLAMYKRFVAATRKGMPDFHVEGLDLILSADRGAGRWLASGTNTGEMMGLPPTGQRALWEGVTIYRFEDGKIAEGWWYGDALGMLQQLGVMPARQRPEPA
jgi:steroid delta-isomerase-like uncharacterized protein